MLRTHQKIRAVLAAEGYLSQDFSPAQVAWLRNQGVMPPIAGASPDDDDDSDSDSDKDDKDADKDKDTDKDSSDDDTDDKDKDSDKDSDKDKDDKDKDDDDVTVPKGEFQRLRRIARDAEKKEKKLADEKKATERRKKAEEGRYQELVNEAEKERDEAFRERDDARAELTKFKRTVLVTTVAQRVGFKDPSDAHLFIAADDSDDEKVAERALQRVLREKPYLKSDRRPTGGPTGDNNGGLTIEDIKGWSQEQINARWDEVQPVLAASGAGLNN
jgi:hypothetical protein